MRFFAKFQNVDRQEMTDYFVIVKLKTISIFIEQCELIYTVTPDYSQINHKN